MHIKQLTIFTNNLSAQVEFYSKIIGLKTIEVNNLQAIFQIGTSQLKLIQKEKSTPYHFAINIPCNQEIEALAWLKERVEVLKDGQHEIQDFDFWNAMAIYFYDKDQNIVEFIARKNMNNQLNSEFNASSLLEISEIGIPVNDIKATFNELNKLCGVEVFDGGFERFLAVGDESGLFICINKKVKDWFPTGDKAYSSEFEITFTEKEMKYQLAFKNEKMMAQMES